MRLKTGMKWITSSLQFRVGTSLAFGLCCTSTSLGAGLLLPGPQYAAGVEPVSVAIGDLDGDQVPDLAVANWSAATKSRCCWASATGRLPAR